MLKGQSWRVRLNCESDSFQECFQKLEENPHARLLVIKGFMPNILPFLSTWTRRNAHLQEIYFINLYENFHQVVQNIKFPPCLKALDINECCLTTSSLDIMFSSISRLEHLNLCEIYLKLSEATLCSHFIQKAGVSKLRLISCDGAEDQLFASLMRLTSLTLSSSWHDDQVLEKLILTLYSHPSLKSLALSSYNFSLPCLTKLASCLGSIPTLRSLHVGNVFRFTADAEKFVESLAENGASLTRIEGILLPETCNLIARNDEGYNRCRRAVLCVIFCGRYHLLGRGCMSLIAHQLWDTRGRMVWIQ